MKKIKTKLLGAELYEEHFSEVYQERWSSLRQAMLKKHEKVMRENFFALPNEKKPSKYKIQWKPFDVNTEKSLGQGALRQHYMMDLASIIAVEQLDILKSDKVLDMCAAPGGKALVLAEKCFHQQQSEMSARLQLNELSSVRRVRLKKVLSNYLPSPIAETINVTLFDAGLIGKHRPLYYDKILLDAPCSSERHLLHKPLLLAQYKVKRSMQLGKRQFGLLVSAWDALKEGGTLIYSTCSISPIENDQVIQRLLKRVGQNIEIIQDCSWANSISIFPEPTEYGFNLFPDKLNIGPIYFCKIKKC